MTVKIRLRRGTAAQWTSANPVLAPGEAGYETDTGKIKYGDGVNAWTALPYFLGNVNNTADNNKNVLSASKLTTARTINGTAFDGTENITIPTGISRTIQNITSPTVLPFSGTTDYRITTSSTVTNASSLVAHIHFEGENNSTSIVDSSETTTWTANGTAKLSTAAARFGTSSLLLDGTLTGYAWTASTNLFNYTGALSFTNEFWINPSNITAGRRGIFSLRNNTGFCPFVLYQNGATLQWLVASAAMNSWAVNLASSASVLTANTWHHIAIVGTGSTLTVYVNGTSALTTTQLAWTASNRAAYIGSDPADSAFIGYIDEFRSNQGFARYTANFTAPSTVFDDQTSITLPSTTSNVSEYVIYNNGSQPVQIKPTSPDKINASSLGTTVALLTDGTSSNKSGNPWGYTGTASSSVQKFSGVNSYSLIGAHIKPLTNADPNYAFALNDFSIEMYIRRSDTVDRTFYDGRNGAYGTGGYGGPFPGMWFEANKLKFAKFDAFTITSTTNFAANTWYHIAVCRRNFITTMYVNGIAEALTYDNGNYLNGQTNHFSTTGACTPYIGATNTETYSTNYANSFNGHVSHIRIMNNGAAYSSNFTPPDQTMSSLLNKINLPGTKTIILLPDTSGNYRMTDYK